jgi:hypothetical protein
MRHSRLGAYITANAIHLAPAVFPATTTDIAGRDLDDAAARRERSTRSASGGRPRSA